MQLEIVEVRGRKLKVAFHQISKDLYAGDAAYISNIYQDIEAVFSSKKNSEWDNGEAKRWLVYDSTKSFDKKVVGKIAAFYNRKSGEAGLGFFDCIDSQEVANALFSVGIDWVRSKGFDRVEAPVNFGERDKYWGLLVEGFAGPSYQENYNFPYYQSLFENFGFSKIIEQTTSEARPENIDLDRYADFANSIELREGLQAKHFKLDEMNRFVKDFTIIYNKAWEQHEHFVAFTEERVAKLFKEMKPIIREDFLWFVYKGNQPIAFYLSLIDLNQIFKYVNGNMNLIGKLKFLWYKRKVNITKARGIIFGVIPEFQGKAVYTIMMMKMHKVISEDPHLQSTELAWIGDFNPKMHALFKSIKAKKTKVHFTYEKLLK